MGMIRGKFIGEIPLSVLKQMVGIQIENLPSVGQPAYGLIVSMNIGVIKGIILL